MKTLLKGIGLVLALIAGSAQAIPTLYFDGNVNFDGGTNILGVNSVLTATSNDISPTPTLAGSKLSLNAVWDHSVTPSPAITFNYFTGAKMTVTDGNANTLLRGNFSELVMKTINNLNSGLLTGTFNAVSGSLANKFNSGNLLSLGFNLSYSGKQNVVSGHINGQISGQNVSVPEPGILALLALGVVLIGFAGKQMGRGRHFHV